jgi:hypothetical protein
MRIPANRDRQPLSAPVSSAQASDRARHRKLNQVKVPLVEELAVRLTGLDVRQEVEGETQFCRSRVSSGRNVPRYSPDGSTFRSGDGNQKALAFDLSGATYMESSVRRMSIAIGVPARQS